MTGVQTCALPISFSSAVEDIAEVLRQADGEQLEGTYNSICSDKVTYLGDSLFKRNDGTDTLSFADAVEGICEVLTGVDGEDLAQTYNSICSDKISYSGDSVFERVAETNFETEVQRG